VRFPYGRFHSFDLWILEDVERHEWSKQTCVFPSSVAWDYVGDIQMSFPGTNKAGEIIMAPKLLSLDNRPSTFSTIMLKQQTLEELGS